MTKQNNFHGAHSHHNDSLEQSLVAVNQSASRVRSKPLITLLHKWNPSCLYTVLIQTSTAPITKMSSPSPTPSSYITEKVQPWKEWYQTLEEQRATLPQDQLDKQPWLTYKPNEKEVSVVKQCDQWLRSDSTCGLINCNK